MDIDTAILKALATQLDAAGIIHTYGNDYLIVYYRSRRAVKLWISVSDGQLILRRWPLNITSTSPSATPTFSPKPSTYVVVISHDPSDTPYLVRHLLPLTRQI